jgi:dihydroorotase-like cyclic amidohydrolase
MAEEVGADLHIVHIGTAAAAEALSQGRATGETGPHYLAFTVDDFGRIGAPLKVAPSVKRAENRDRLWQLLADGTLDFVASDHAPCRAQDKATGSIWTDYSGIPGTGTMLPYMFSEGYLKGRLSLKRFLEVVSENAAKRYGLDDRKGTIEVGKDADLVLLDPAQEWAVEGQAFLSKGKVTPFEGMVLKGRVLQTVLRGQVVYDCQEGIVAPAGCGRWLCPKE